MTTPQRPIVSGFHHGSTAAQVTKGKDLSGRVAIVTGGYGGIGLETSKALAKAGATVIVPARNTAAANAALAGIPGIQVEQLDLMDPASVDGFAERFLVSGKPLHLLINNAGIMAAPLARDSRGYESQFATNHLGHFQLTARLWPVLRQSGSARVITVSSRAHRLGGVQLDDPHFHSSAYDKWKAYAQSKSANVLFAVELDRLGQRHGVRAFAVHPGLIPTTGIGRFGAGSPAGSGFTKRLEQILLAAANKLQLAKLGTLGKKHPADKFKSISQGAATTLWCATSEHLNGMGGVYCEDCNISEAVTADSNAPYGVRPWATDPGLAKRLWQLSGELTDIRFDI